MTRSRFRLFGIHQVTTGILLAGMLGLLALPVAAVMSGGESQRALANDADYAAGLAAVESGDWQSVVAHMRKVVDRRPWHDNAHNLMGFAYRKLGDYDRSLQFYDKALGLNPHNRGALEYLGEAYLDLDQPEHALAQLAKLEIECRRIAAGFPDGWQSGCREWQGLKTAYDAYLQGPPRASLD